MPEQHRMLSFNGGELHYRVEGRENTKTIVLLHGLLQDLSIWEPMTLRLLHNYRVVSIDLPGHGFSSMYNKDCHSMTFLAQCVNEVLIELGIQDCVIVGHSWGGYVAMAYTEQYTYNVKGLVLLHSIAIADSPEMQKSRERVCQEVENQRPSYVMQFISSLFSAKSHTASHAHEIAVLTQQALSVKTEAIIAAERGMMRRPSYINLLARLQSPVLFIYGKEDTRIPLEVATAMATIPPYSETLLLNDVAHMAHIESPVAVTRTLSNFIETSYSNPLL